MFEALQGLFSPVGAAEQNQRGLEILQGHEQSRRLKVHVLSLTKRARHSGTKTWLQKDNYPDILPLTVIELPRYLTVTDLKFLPSYRQERPSGFPDVWSTKGSNYPHALLHSKLPCHEIFMATVAKFP